MVLLIDIYYILWKYLYYYFLIFEEVLGVWKVVFFVLGDLLV